MSENFKTYECRYFHNGKWWAIRITADNVTDAESRIAKLGNLQLQGEVVCDIPSKFGWLGRFIVWLKNLTASTP